MCVYVYRLFMHIHCMNVCMYVLCLCMHMHVRTYSSCNCSSQKQKLQQQQQNVLIKQQQEKGKQQQQWKTLSLQLPLQKSIQGIVINLCLYVCFVWMFVCMNVMHAYAVYRATLLLLLLLLLMMCCCSYVWTTILQLHYGSLRHSLINTHPYIHLLLLHVHSHTNITHGLKSTQV